MASEQFLAHCENNNLGGVADCLSRGVDVNTTDVFGDTGLIFACMRGHSAIVSSLVQVPGLDIDHQAGNGMTAAHHASVKGRTECVRILADTGKVDWNRRDREGRTPLYMALSFGHSDTVDIIVKQPDIDFNVMTNDDEDGETYPDSLAQVAVSRGDVNCVETLAGQERFDCWNTPDIYGNTPIMYAVQAQKKEICEILLKCPRVDVNLTNNNDEDLHHMAVDTDNSEILEMVEDCPRFIDDDDDEYEDEDSSSSSSSSSDDYEDAAGSPGPQTSKSILAAGFLGMSLLEMSTSSATPPAPSAPPAPTAGGWIAPSCPPMTGNPETPPAPSAGGAGGWIAPSLPQETQIQREDC